MSINVTPIPQLIELATPAFSLGTANAAGSAATAVASNSTLLAFDTTLPDAITLGQSGSVGTATVAPRRDHAHAMENVDQTGIAKGYCQVAGDGSLQSGSFNVTSSSKISTGYFQIVWDTDFANTSYVASMICQQASPAITINIRAVATTHIDSQAFDTSNSTEDCAMQVIAFGAQ